MAPVTPVQPVTMGLNQEVEEEGTCSQSDCNLHDSTRVTAHVTSNMLVSLPKMHLILRIG